MITSNMIKTIVLATFFFFWSIWTFGQTYEKKTNGYNPFSISLSYSTAFSTSWINISSLNKFYPLGISIMGEYNTRSRFSLLTGISYHRRREHIEEHFHFLLSEDNTFDYIQKDHYLSFPVILRCRLSKDEAKFRIFSTIGLSNGILTYKSEGTYSSNLYSEQGSIYKLFATAGIELDYELNSQMKLCLRSQIGNSFFTNYAYFNGSIETSLGIKYMLSSSQVH